ncbi:MAG: hypothetical protein NUV55_11050 [Sulfuricaulis sp.]|uniref:hypothetical protein n=1 Tax=Sulfuricaulis sp. TaxID=2003553 RepID=UPI0025F40197|nr:hypothetical protein [Sulfuricaulis sp.]MCR4347721.1 hypothetical protein [Sulfuricaulis sp.]
MKALLGKYQLLNRQTGELEWAELFLGIDGSNLAAFEREWRPAFLSVHKASLSSAGSSPARAEDARWDWSRIAQTRMNPLLYQMFAVECAGTTQGLMLVRKGGKFSRHPDHERADIIYVECVATAPWNRPSLVKEDAKYKGVGQLLLGTAVSYSVAEELNGRIGLHSLPGAETFYRDVLGMTDFGPDSDYQSFCYFEFSETQLATFFSTNSQGG